MAGGIRVADRIDEGAWRGFVEAQAGGNIFHTPEMFRVFDRARHHRTAVWAAIDGAGNPVALLTPVEIALNDGLLRSWTSRAVAYGGLLCSDGLIGVDGVRQLLAEYREGPGRRPLFTELRHQSDPGGVREVLHSMGFSHEDHLNFLIDLHRPEDTLWGGLSKTAQQRVRSGLGKDVVVEETVDQPGLEQTYSLLEEGYRRIGVPLADRSLFRAALSILHPLGMFRVFTARLGERVIATRYVLLYKDRILDWYAGVDRTFGPYSPNEVLVWHILRWGRACGYGIFDFGGAGRPDEAYGPRDFKSKFGGDIVNFGRDVLVHSPARLRLSRTGYAAARRFLWRRTNTRRRVKDD